MRTQTLAHPISTPLRRRTIGALGTLLAVAILAISLVGVQPAPASAAAPPINQCNDDTASNVGGQGIACTVTIQNYIHIGGNGVVEATAPSTITVTRCTGAAGPVAAGAGTCTTESTTSAEPILIVQQCNGSGNGGGGVVLCTVTISTIISSTLVDALTPATVYQCIGSVNTGPGAPGNCSPENTAGITSVTVATVGQCNGSGNGGTSVGFTCTVSGDSTMTAAFPINVDQCNNSANGGGAQVNCSVTVTNEALAQPAPTPTPTVKPPVTPTPAPTAAPMVAPTPAPTVTPIPDAAPQPADTGNAGLAVQPRTISTVTMLLGITALALILTAGRLVVARRHS